MTDVNARITAAEVLAAVSAWTEKHHGLSTVEMRPHEYKMTPGGPVITSYVVGMVDAGDCGKQRQETDAITDITRRKTRASQDWDETQQALLVIRFLLAVNEQQKPLMPSGWHFTVHSSSDRWVLFQPVGCSTIRVGKWLVSAGSAPALFSWSVHDRHMAFRDDPCSILYVLPVDFKFEWPSS